VTRVTPEEFSEFERTRPHFRRFPAQAKIHVSAVRVLEKWIPAVAFARKRRKAQLTDSAKSP
jgi:hypothetical protein